MENEKLFTKYCALRALTTEGVAEVRHELGLIFKSEGYQCWLRSSQQPFAPKSFKDQSSLKSLGLLENGVFPFRINWMKEQDLVFLTDGLWVDPRWRVFPFADESEELQAIYSRMDLDQFDWVMDMAMGCGHSVLPISMAKPVWGLELNPRALLFAKINQVLNGIKCANAYFVLNDIRDGVNLPLSGRGLVLGNLPFGPNPSPGRYPLTSGGGRYGLDFQIAATQAIKNWCASNSLDVDLILVGISFGDPSSQAWQIEKSLGDIAGIDRCQWNVLDSSPPLRDKAGRRYFENPAPIHAAFEEIVSNGPYSDPSKVSEFRKEYLELEGELRGLGWTHLSYGYTHLRIAS